MTRDLPPTIDPVAAARALYQNNQQNPVLTYVIGVSILSGAHMTVFPRIINSLREKGADDILVIGGGVIPDDDVAKLKEVGVKELMLQDTPPDAIVAMIRRIVAERGAR